MTHLIRLQVVLEEGTIDIIVFGIAVDEPVQEESIYRGPPVIRRGEICVIRPVNPVVCGVGRGLVLVEIVLEEGLIVGPAHYCCCEQRKQRTWRPHPHVGGSTIVPCLSFYALVMCRNRAMIDDMIEMSERDSERSSEDVILIYPRIPHSGSGDSEKAHTRPKVKQKTNDEIRVVQK